MEKNRKGIFTRVYISEARFVEKEKKRVTTKGKIITAVKLKIAEKGEQIKAKEE